MFVPTFKRPQYCDLLHLVSARKFEWDVVLVGHFLPWKKHWKILEFPGNAKIGWLLIFRGSDILFQGAKKLVIGEMKPDCEGCQQIVDHLRREGVTVSNMVPPHQLADIYRSAKLVIFPMEVVTVPSGKYHLRFQIAGGGERALLEARACGAEVWVTPDNAKLQWLLKAPIWDETYYFENLFLGIKYGFLCFLHHPLGFLGALSMPVVYPTQQRLWTT